MIVYQIRDKKTGRFYKCGPNDSIHWVNQQEASVWTTPEGPNACLGTITRRSRPATYFALGDGREPEIVSFQIVSPVTVGVIYGNDREALYLNGKLVQEDHHIPLNVILQFLGIDCEIAYPDDSWLEARGRFPENFDEVHQ